MQQLAANLNRSRETGEPKTERPELRSASRNDRGRRSFTFSPDGASADANGEDNRTNCNQEFFHDAPRVYPVCLYCQQIPQWLYFGNILKASTMELEWS